MAFLAQHSPNGALAYLKGLNTVETEKNLFVYWNQEDGSYVHVGRERVYSSADMEEDFILLPALSQADATFLLGLTTKASAALPYTIPEENPELEMALLRVVIYYNPNIKTLTARQTELVARIEAEMVQEYRARKARESVAGPAKRRLIE